MYVKLFNLIMKTGLCPEKWRENYVKSICKGGCFNDPNNYRGIALSSCVAKLFSKVLFNRLDKQLENNKTLAEEQIGFCKGCSPSDHVLTLKTLIDKTFKSSKRFYACFVDLRKAYDTVNRIALFLKLSSLNISGIFFNILKDMHREVSFSTKFAEGATAPFTSKVGDKQGCVQTLLFFRFISMIFLEYFITYVNLLNWVTRMYIV